MRDSHGRFKHGNKRPQSWTDAQTIKVSDANNYAWKGERVSYRGLHQWIRRKKGKPTKCSFCGKEDLRPRYIQWANTDGKYRRVLDDYIALCGSCHKLKDLAMKSTRDAPAATRLSS